MDLTAPGQHCCHQPTPTSAHYPYHHQGNHLKGSKTQPGKRQTPSHRLRSSWSIEQDVARYQQQECCHTRHRDRTLQFLTHFYALLDLLTRLWRNVSRGLPPHLVAAQDAPQDTTPEHQRAQLEAHHERQFQVEHTTTCHDDMWPGPGYQGDIGWPDACLH